MGQGNTWLRHFDSLAHQHQINAIVTAAQAFAKPTHAHNRTSDPTEVIDVDVDDEHACFVDNSDSDSDCNVSKSLSLYQPH